MIESREAWVTQDGLLDVFPFTFGGSVKMRARVDFHIQFEDFAQSLNAKLEQRDIGAVEDGEAHEAGNVTHSIRVLPRGQKLMLRHCRHVSTTAHIDSDELEAFREEVALFEGQGQVLREACFELTFKVAHS